MAHSIRKTASVVLVTTVLAVANAAQIEESEAPRGPTPDFDKSKDLLLAQYDLANDEDDIQALAALGCVLASSEWSGIRVYGVLGSSSPNQGKPQNRLSPIDLFDAVFGDGPSAETWTDRQSDDAKSITRVAAIVQSTIRNGGRVFVAEAGHYPFTLSWVNHLVDKGMLTAEQIKEKVIVVQHSLGNIKRSAGDSYKQVVALTTHIKIPDGNRPYGSSETSFLLSALSDDNPNAVARELWLMADDYIRNADHNGISNKRIANKGVDFSDFIEVKWILNLRDVDDVSTFWSEYVTNSPSVGKEETRR